MPDDNLHKLNRYFNKYIDKMLVKDIELLKVRNNEFKFSYPYILLVSSCIDLLGGIENGFSKSNGSGNSKDRFVWFITEWMCKVNPLYGESNLAYLIYDSWRCGAMHQASLKRGFETSSHMYPRDKHLHYIEDNENIFIHSLQFADDLIEAQKLYRQYINNQYSDAVYIDSLYSHLLEMIEENNPEKELSFNKFVNYLQSNNLIFNSTDGVDADVSIIPSAAPTENDLE